VLQRLTALEQRIAGPRNTGLDVPKLS
jgi:hypothetical protein